MFKSILLVLGLCLAAQAEITLTPDNTINFRGEVNEDSVAAAQIKINELVIKRGKAVYPLYLVLDSPGGDIMAGQSFIEFAKSAPHLETVNMFAASMASGIQQALPGKRNGWKFAISMFHRAKGAFQGQFSEGEVESRLKMAQDMVSILESANAKRLNISLAEYKSKVKDELWIVGSDNLKQNALDALEDIKCSAELIASSETQNVAFFGMSIGLKWNGCPLFRTPTITKGHNDYLKYKAQIDKMLTGIYYNFDQGK